MTSTFTWCNLCWFDMPVDGDVLVMPKGVRWVVRRDGSSWSLVSGSGKPHPEIQNLGSVKEFIDAVYEVGCRDEKKRIVHTVGPRRVLRFGVMR